MKAILKMSLDCGRCGDLSFITLMNEKTFRELEALKKHNPDLCVTEVLGKHSETCFSFNEVEVEVKEISEDVYDTLCEVGRIDGGNCDFIEVGIETLREIHGIEV